MIDVLGADHGGYVKRMKAAVKAVTDDRGHLNVKLVERLDIKVVQLVRLLRKRRAGEDVKSVRAISSPCAKWSTRSAPTRCGS